MKLIVIVIIFGCFLTPQMSLAQEIMTEEIEEIDVACKVLMLQTNAAIKKKDFYKVSLYYNAFITLKEQYKVQAIYIDYFSSVNTEKNKNLIGRWVIGLGIFPKNINSMVLGDGFENNQKDKFGQTE